MPNFLPNSARPFFLGAREPLQNFAMHHRDEMATFPPRLPPGFHHPNPYIFPDMQEYSRRSVAAQPNLLACQEPTSTFQMEGMPRDPATFYITQGEGNMCHTRGSITTTTGGMKEERSKSPPPPPPPPQSPRQTTKVSSRTFKMTSSEHSDSAASSETSHRIEDRLLQRKVKKEKKERQDHQALLL